jgi:NAD(P)-dependent dehydrogenase (short-subunit alcohol dehydrogenase family)
MSPTKTSPRLLVSGAASGIGRAVCARATERGWRVVGLDRDAQALASAADELGVATVVCDVTDEADVVRAVAAAADLVGGTLDAVVCAAGVYDIVPAAELSAERFERLLRINVIGSFLTAREAVRLMHEPPGSVVLLASMASERADLAEPGAHYTASKGAVVSLTRQLAIEYAELGVRVNAVSPGVIRTPMLRLSDDPQRLAAYLAEGVPLHRLGEADDVAAACLYLASDESAYVTGAILPVDGGVTIA